MWHFTPGESWLILGAICSTGLSTIFTALYLYDKIKLNYKKQKVRSEGKEALVETWKSTFFKRRYA